ncbi:unnamed protein product [Adineta steineri]|uniref:Uncharacterized protein n=3 Tax=Adineta steineri TaxID=433720 RepID=A0A813WJD4_9BILA|nr:unnamed protein product [Adineta steineri]
MLVASIPDTEYEQVIAERYLFAPFANESTAWSVLSTVRRAWQVTSLPQYHLQATEGVWLLIQTATEALQISWMSLSANGTLGILTDIDVKSNNSFLVVSHNKATALKYTAALISPQDIQLILCSQSDATACRVTQTIPFPSVLANISKITASLFVEDLGTAGWLYIATDVGLHGLDLSTFTVNPFLCEINVTVSSLAWSYKRQTIFIGTETKLWIHTYSASNEGWRFEQINGLIDAPITSLVYNDAQDKLYIGQNTGITLLSPIVMSNGRLCWFFSRLAGQISNPGSDIGHLPFANITVLGVSHSTSSDSRVWLGSIRGVMRFDSNSTDINAWRVFNSARYMPNRESQVNVTSLAVLSRNNDAPASLGSALVAITSKGLAVIRFEMWTLERKAKHFQTFLDQPDRHDKYGLVSGCDMTSWGDSRTCIKGPDDNDGLWTSMYLSSQIFRYAVTQDTAVKMSAWRHFETLELLNQVSGSVFKLYDDDFTLLLFLIGISGYPGRSLAKRSDFPPDPHWHPSPINSTLQFKGDTSSDEITGHEYVYPLVHDLLAGNDDERRRAYALVLNITTHILTHDWYLVGENHTHTTWGIWNPIQINNDSYYQESRGLNSLQVLAFLFQTYAYSADERFLDGAQLLIESYGYDINLINQKMIATCDGDFSDDELAYLAYFNLVHAFYTISSSTKLSSAQKTRAQLIIDDLWKFMKVGLDLSHIYKQMEKSPFYNFIYCYASGQVNQTRNVLKKRNGSKVQSFDFDCNSLSNDGIWYMQRWPLELINWQQFNSDRLDIEINVPATACNTHQERLSIQMLPPDERSTKKWNSAVYDVDDGNGYSEDDPTTFLLSYWGMRYFNLLE